MNDRLKRLQQATRDQLASDNSSGNDEVISTKDASRTSSDFNQTANSFQKYARQSSLAQSLKQRRDFKEIIESERQALNMTGKSFTTKQIIKQTDEAGSAIRIRKESRPETPKVNLLELQRRRNEALTKVRVGEKKVFNYNPYTNLANIP